MSGYEDPGGSNPDPLMAFVSRWWWILVVGVVLGACIAVAYATYGPDAYTSTSLIQIQAQTGDDPTAKAEQARSATANYAAEASSTRIYALVDDATSGEFSVNELSRMDRNGKIVIQAMRNANFITIKVTDSDPVRARSLANTISTVVVDDINERAKIELDLRNTQLGEQIEFARQQLASAELFRREEQLDVQVRDQRSHLLSLQASYQQELARQADVTTQSEEQNSLHSAYLEVVTSQIADVEDTVESLNKKLEEVRLAISTLPTGSDAVLSGAYATAYSQELTALTRQYVSQQLATVTTKPPLVRYGDASAPIRAQNLKKLGLLGIAAGGTVAAGIAYALELIMKRRARKETAQSRFGSDVDLDRLIHRLNQFGIGQSSNPTADASLIRHSSAAADHGGGGS